MTQRFRDRLSTHRAPYRSSAAHFLAEVVVHFDHRHTKWRAQVHLWRPSQERQPRSGRKAQTGVQLYHRDERRQCQPAAGDGDDDDPCVAAPGCYPAWRRLASSSWKQFLIGTDGPACPRVEVMALRREDTCRGGEINIARAGGTVATHTSGVLEDVYVRTDKLP